MIFFDAQDFFTQTSSYVFAGCKPGDAGEHHHVDRIIEKERWSRGRWAAILAFALAIVLMAWQLVARANSSRLTVDAGRITTDIVEDGTFLEYFPIDGTVVPATSVYLDVDEGGRVEEIFVEGGQHIEKDALILKFSNPSLQRTAIETETQLLYNLDIQRSSEFDRAQNALILRENMLDLEHQILDSENKTRRFDELMKTGNSAISTEQYEIQRNALEYLKKRRALLQERIRREDELGKRQITQVQHSIERLNTSLELLAKIVQSLEVRAPIAGFVSTISAEVGQNIPRGQRIGQIDLLDEFKVRARIDQFYIGRVAIETHGRVNLDGRSWEVKVAKVYPEVKDNAFEADLVFVGKPPGSLKRGQTVTIELTFGAPSRTLTVAKGGFFLQTSGRWVYLIASDGRTARRTEVRLGRQNPRDVEVIDGLRSGDRIITSSYDGYNGVDELKFNEPLKNRRALK
jgi:HlyD family secretion protein